MARPLPLDTLYSPVSELAPRIKARRLSPVDLAEAYLDRLAKLGPKYGAVVTLTRDRALAEARAADQELRKGRYRGPLHGIPYGVKDLLATKGIPTSWGAEPYRDQVFDHDSTVVRKLHSAGAVLVAKLAMVELAGGFGYNQADASFTGPGRTPWNADYWSGGSSTGSGAAVSAALVPFAIGSETSGSILTPAAFCGVTGLRPTYGRVSRHGAMALSWTLDKLGPLGRTAEDCGLVLSAIAGRDPRDPSCSARPYPEPRKPRPGGAKPRVGVLKDAAERVQPEVKKNFEGSLAVLGKFAEVVEDVELPDFPYGDAIGTIIRAEGASAFQDLLDSGKAAALRAPNDRWGGYAGETILAVDYLQAMRLRGPMRKALDALYAKYDAIVAPSRATVSYPVDVPFAKAYPGGKFAGPAIGRLITATNLVGLPAVFVPNGFGAKRLPTGLQLTGRAWSEHTLLEIAAAYQKRTDWHTNRPPEPKA
jgi:aspartyl-tRNA(Asn)/glutamyl-tRNA(Gln) amidotransferase subunit A